MSGAGIQTEKLTLETVVDGKLEEKFQECLDEVSDILAQSGRYQDSKGWVSVPIKMEVVVRMNVENGIVLTSASSFVKHPKPVGVDRAAYLNNEGEWLVQKDQQLEIEGTDHNVRPISPDQVSQ